MSFFAVHGRALGLFAVAFPLTLGGVLLSPGLVSEAAGCSGGPNTAPGWHSLTSEDDPNLATDGVVLLRGSYLSMSPEAALAAVEIHVTDATSADVPGATSVLELSPPHDTTPSDALLVWHPAASLAPSTTYTATWSVVDPQWVSGEVTLSTGTGPGSTTTPTVGDAQIVHVLEFQGDPVSCPEGPGPCGPYVFEDAEVERTRLSLNWTIPVSPTGQALLFELAPVAGKGTLMKSGPIGYFGSMEASEQRSLSVRFSDEAEEYCVELITRDLRNDAQLDSQQICAAAPSAPASFSPLDSALKACSNSPSDSLLPRWCSFHPGSEECVGAVGTGGGASSATPGGRTSSDGGCACAAAPKNRPGPRAVLLLAALLLVSRRRNRALRP